MKQSTKLRQVRRARDITQVQLAERAGVARQTIHALERDKATRPSWDTVYRLAKALDTDPLELFPVEQSSGEAA